MRSLSKLVASFLSSQVSATRAYVCGAAPMLAEVITKSTDGDKTNGAAVRKAWREMNVKAYRANKLRRSMPEYRQLAKLNSMLLAIGLRKPAVLGLYCEGKYVDLQKAYRTSASRSRSSKPATFPVRFERYLASLTAAQRRYAVANIRRIVNAL